MEERKKKCEEAANLLKENTPILPLPLPSIPTLRSQLQSGTLLPSNLLRSIIQHTLNSQDNYNCLTELFSKDSLEYSQEQDLLRVDNEVLPPFYGIPISLKDNYNIEPYDTTLGYSFYVGKPPKETSILVSICKDLGFIPYCKTNVPQSLFQYECSNPLFGLTLHPKSKDFTPGGSSGGEASLIASGASLFGLGTDIGGSLRIPAAFTGICALKPSFGRIPGYNVAESFPGQESIRQISGPMARDVRDLEDFMCSLAAQKAWEVDPSVVELPWREPLFPDGRLRFGYYIHNGFVPASPACQRAVIETISKLRASGHECIEFIIPSIEEAMIAYYGLIAIDGGKSLIDPLTGDPMDAAVHQVKFTTNLWWPFRKALVWVFKNIVKDPVLALIIEWFRKKSISEQWELVKRRDDYRKLFLDTWQAAQAPNSGKDLTAIICPVNSLAAIPHYRFGEVAYSASYSTLYNLLDYPAGVVPVGQVIYSDLISTEKSWDKTSNNISPSEKALRKVQDEKNMTGMPLAVQVVGARLREEWVLAAMRVVEKVVKEK